MEAQVALIAAFRSSALLGLVSLIFLLTYSLDSLYGVQVWWVCWPIKHSNTMVIQPAFGTFGSVGRCQVLLENEISISIKLVSKRKHEVLEKFLVDGCVDCGLQKTQWTNTSRWHGSPNHHWLETSHWTWSNVDSVLLHSSCRLWDFDFQIKCKIYFYLKRGLWTRGLHWVWAPAGPNANLAGAGGFTRRSWSEIKRKPISSNQSTLHLICFDTALLEQPPLSAMTLCDLPSLWRVSMIIFWTITKSAVFPIIVLSKNKRYPECILYGWSFIYVNILIFWDTDFWLSLAVRTNYQKKKKNTSLKCFTLHIINLKYMKVSLFELGKKKKRRTFSPYSIFLRCTCTCSVYQLLCSFVLFSQQFSQCTVGVTE